jgi:integrase
MPLQNTWYQTSTASLAPQQENPSPAPKSKAQPQKQKKSSAALSKPNKNDPRIIDFLLEFWQKDSAYAKGKKLRGKPLTLKYIEGNHRALRNHATPLLGRKKLSEFSPALFEQLLQQLAEAGAGARTINMIRQAILVAVGNYYRMQYLPNPLTCIEKVAEKPKERGILTQKEIKALVAINGYAPRVKAAFILAACCGLRRGEVRGLKMEDVDYENHCIHVRHNLVDEREGVKAPKCGSTRTVPVPDFVLELLVKCKEENPNALYLLGTHQSALGTATIKRSFPKMLLDIGIDAEEKKRRNLCFHGLRHTYVSLLRSASVSDVVTMRLAGHKSPQMMERYSHVDTRDCGEMVTGQLTKLLA